METKERYVLVWSIAGQHKGAFCPSGGLSRDDAERARDRLCARALGNDGLILTDVSLVPYVFDVDVDPIRGLSSAT